MRVIHTNLTYFCKNVSCFHVQCLYMLIVRPPKHWFHMVLETRYKHLRHQKKSVSECSKRVHLTNTRLKTVLGADFNHHTTSNSELCGGNSLQVCVGGLLSEEAAAVVDLALSMRGGSFLVQTAEGVLTFATAKPVTRLWFLSLSLSLLFI